MSLWTAGQCALGSVFRYLCFGSDELVMHKTWLADRQKMRLYTAYTMRQLQQGSVVKTVQDTRNEAFWEAQAAKQQTRRPKVVSGRFT